MSQPDIYAPAVTPGYKALRTVVSGEIFNKLDSKIWNMLWHLAKRRHKNKSKSWIAKVLAYSRKAKLGFLNGRQTTEVAI